MSILIKGNPKEGEYKLIKTTDGFILEGKDLAYACIEIGEEAIDIAQDIMDGCKELKERVNKDIVTCRECKYFNLNEWDETISGVPIIVAHEICHKWGNGCKTDSNGFCFMGERRADDNTIKTNK